MDNINKYFTIGTVEYQKTMKTCLLMGLIVGLIMGGIILYRIIN